MVRLSGGVGEREKEIKVRKGGRTDGAGYILRRGRFLLGLLCPEAVVFL